MKEKQDYIRDIAEIRSMMERSSKFLSLSGWAGIMAGTYALSGAYIAYSVFHFLPDEIMYMPAGSGTLRQIILESMVLFLLAMGTAIFFSYKRAARKGEDLWNAASRQLLMHLAIPLVAGGVLILVFLSQGLIGLIAPMTLLFYGLALYNASQVTSREVKILGLTEMGLGLISALFIEYSLVLWAFGFGIVHIVYGIVIHYRYER